MLGNLVSEEFQKSKLKISCCNQLLKYVEQLPVTLLFFLFWVFVWNIFNLLLISSLFKISVFDGCNKESWEVYEFTSIAMLLRNYQQTTFKVNSKCHFSNIAEPQALLNLLVFLFRFSLFWGTEIILYDGILKDALQKDGFLNFKFKWFVTLKRKMISSRKNLYQMLIVDRELNFYDSIPFILANNLQYI